MMILDEKIVMKFHDRIAADAMECGLRARMEKEETKAIHEFVGARSMSCSVSLLRAVERKATGFSTSQTLRSAGVSGSECG